MTQNESNRDNVLKFPKKKPDKIYIIDDIEGVEQSINRYGKFMKKQGRSEGFFLGCLFAGCFNLLIHWVTR